MPPDRRRAYTLSHARIWQEIARQLLETADRFDAADLQDHMRATQAELHRLRVLEAADNAKVSDARVLH